MEWPFGLWARDLEKYLEAPSMLSLFPAFEPPKVSIARRMRWRLECLRERCERAYHILRYGYDKHGEDYYG